MALSQKSQQLIRKVFIPRYTGKLTDEEVEEIGWNLCTLVEARIKYQKLSLKPG
jgi:hypothetical protein